MTRLPLPLFRLLVGPALLDPALFGFRLVGYDGAPWLVVDDAARAQQTLWAFEESLVAGQRRQSDLYRALRALVKGPGR